MSRTNTVCCILPFPLSLGDLSEEFQLNISEPGYVIGVYYLTIIERNLKSFEDLRRE